MPLDNFKLSDYLISIFKFKSFAHRIQIEKLFWKSKAMKSHLIGEDLPNQMWLFLFFNECLVIFYVPDFQRNKFDTISVGFDRTEKVRGGLSKLKDCFRSYFLSHFL